MFIVVDPVFGKFYFSCETKSICPC